MTEPREILVRGPNWAGDLAMATPGFRALRAAHPAARIRLVLRAGLEPLVAGAPWFDEVLPFTAWRRGPLAVVRAGLVHRGDAGVREPLEQLRLVAEDAPGRAGVVQITATSWPACACCCASRATWVSMPPRSGR